MKAVWKITMYTLNLEEHQRFTTFPASRMPLLTQFQLHHAIPDNLASDLYAGRLTYSLSDDNDTSEDEVSSPHSMPQIQYPTPDTRSSPSKHTLAAYEHLEEEADEEEDFQTIPLDGEHWTTEEIPDRPLCIHKHPLSCRLCPNPYSYMEYQTSSYYKTMELCYISNFKDLMTTSSDEDIPALEDNTY